MKKNNFLILLIYLISINILTSCSHFKHYNYSKKRMNVDEFQYNTQNDTQNFHQKKFKEIQNLQHNNVIYFSLDKYDISTQFFYILDIHADFLCENPDCSVKIEGHADERGTPEYNIALGERRANSVKLYLQSKGVLSEQIYIVSYGKEKPAILGHNEEAYSKNRRAILLYKQQ